MRRRILTSLAAAVAVAASISISAAGSAAAQPDASAASTAEARGGGGGATPITDRNSPIFVDSTQFKIVATLRGAGSQVYTCGADGKYALREPVATLQNSRGGGTVGIHGKGPFWASFDGSRVDGTGAGSVPSPDGPRNIAWLKVARAPISPEAPGVFGKVAFIQRVDTRGGVAPGSCTGSSTISVPYSTNYVFWEPKS